MVHSNQNQSRRGRRWKEKSRISEREENLAAHVQTVQASFEAADSCESPLHKNVDSAQDNRINTNRSCRKSRKRAKDNRCDTRHTTYSSHLPHLEVGPKHSSSLRIPKRRKVFENTNYIPLPSANKLILSAEKENNSLTNIVSDDSNNCCIPSIVNLDVPDCSHIRVPGKHKRKINCLNNEVQENHSTGTGCLPDSIIHEVEDDSGDLSLKNMGSLDKEMDVPPVLPKRDTRNCSDIRVSGNRKRKINCLKSEVQENHSSDTGCFPDSIIHENKDDSGDLALKNVGSSDKEMDAPLILPKRDAPNSSDLRVSGKRNRKIKCLNNEVQENHSADTGFLLDSIIHEDKDDTSDLALKDMGSLDKEMDVPPVLPKRASRITFRKKLLVLDLNGILCDVVFGSHGSHMPYKKVSMKSVFKRPFLDDFMIFCFERFAVGIWSSRNKRNITGVIDYIMGDTKDKLLFCWDQSKCTLTGFNTVKDKYKPLVLKELIKLWDKEEATLPWEKGDFSPSNTLLVDDSPYKAICNPPNTAIFPFPYDFRDESDTFLGPGGALRVYLEKIAMADDVQEHVKEHSFGQRAITSEDKMWSFYKRIIDKYNSVVLT